MKNIALSLYVLVAPALFAQSADLVLTKSDSPDPVVKNTNLTFTVSVLNNGPSAATNVVVTDELDGNVSFVSAEQTAGPTATMSHARRRRRHVHGDHSYPRRWRDGHIRPRRQRVRALRYGRRHDFQ